MPTYCFRCLSCDQQFDLFLKIAERNDESAPNRRCPTCGQGKLEQLITSNAGILTGKTAATDWEPSCQAEQGGSCEGCACSGDN